MSVTSGQSAAGLPNGGGVISSPRLSVGLGSCSSRALAVVTNKWYREQRRAEQDMTRSLTILKHRKISCILKVGHKTDVENNYKFIKIYIVQFTLSKLSCLFLSHYLSPFILSISSLTRQLRVKWEIITIR